MSILAHERNADFGIFRSPLLLTLHATSLHCLLLRQIRGRRHPNVFKIINNLLSITFLFFIFYFFKKTLTLQSRRAGYHNMFGIVTNNQNKKMIWKVLKNNIKKVQIFGVFLGVLLGFLILTGALNFFLDVKPIFEDKSGFWKEEYIIINKKIFLSNTLTQMQSNKGYRTNFTDAEIDKIKAQKNVKDIAGFSACSFAIQAFAGESDFLPNFRTDLFFEAVPDKFVDVNSDDWHFNIDTNFVPIIIPKAYLNLYNFGFAQSQNLPQISEDALSAINLKLRIRGNSKTQNFNTRIVGFSERINTILVPKSFVDWANLEFGTNPSPTPGRLIIVTYDPTNKDFFDFLENQNYDVNKSEINNSKALSFLKIITSIIFIIGLIIIVMAFAIMLVSIQLLLQRNSENIKKLNILGFSLKEITKPYKIFVIILFSTIYIFSIIILFCLRQIYMSKISLFGYGVSDTNFLYVLGSTFILVGLIIILLIFIINNNTKSIIK